MRVRMEGNDQNRFFSAQRVNASLKQQREPSAALKENERKERRDQVSISPGGKLASQMESLMKQKQRITEQKNELINKTLEGGNSLDMIKPQLEIYEEQMMNIESQIAQLQAQKAEEAAKNKPGQKDEDDVKNTDATVKAAEKDRGESVSGGTITQITALGMDIEKTKVVASGQKKVDAEVRAIKREIKQDGFVTPLKAERLQERMEQDTQAYAQLGKNISNDMEATKEVTKSMDEESIENSQNPVETTENTQI